ncbi:hypothetical protein HYH03_017541 [Edaphochlamys debaryana]|uniref:Uncharacterized protein n=1 Tax=Edaphochlamys debaryana TaxID=47281 RepID=A0A835XHP8_9CHLO|nr:hypothetical protein HYH03_017541 [Edaphochlamys debaryana]|eukprot:KAG2483599.1 hypothetical protein HYH03_017541 [Edaphochlamys debaryana]
MPAGTADPAATAAGVQGQASAFQDPRKSSRVTLEFSPARLEALEPALGGAWGRRLQERCLTPLVEQPQVRAGRRRSTAAVRRGAAMRRSAAALFPEDVERRFDRRTGTASLSTARYGSREANRKLLLEQYAELLRTVALAASVEA